MTNRTVARRLVPRVFLLNMFLLVGALLFALHSIAAHAADPSLQEVYTAASAGNYRAAQGMMDQVLRDHPNSAKAHFVEAELLAKQGQLARADSELRQAERLEPGLPFAKPESVAELHTLLAAPAHAAPVAGSAPVSSGLPWGLIITGLFLLAAVILFFRSRSPVQQYIPAGATGYGGSYGPTPYGGQPPFGPVGGAGGGMGSTILGGLATGAAVGAGMVAGEELMHRVLDGGREPRVVNDGFAGYDNSQLDAERSYDMGGNDFGVNDTSSWDDSSSGGSNDWS